MAVRKSILGILSSITLGLVAFTAQPAAATEAGACTMALMEAQDARASLEAITTAMDQGVADRAAWLARIDAIDSELAGLVGEKNGQTETLKRERAELVEELRTLDKLHPVLANQAEALRSIVDEAERSYISCIEATL